MALTLTEFLDNLYTTTWQNMKSQTADQVFNATPFWFWMKDKGKLKRLEGGRFISEPLEFDKNDNIQWITKGGTTPLNDFEFLTIAKYDWRYLTASIVRFGIDDQQNRGRNMIISLMNAKMGNTNNSLITEMETRLAGADGTSANAIHGLQHLVPDDPTSGALANLGGIDGALAANNWWRNKTRSMTTESFATFGISRMRTMLNDVMNNRKMDAPDIIVSGQTPYELYEDTALSVYRIQNNKMADMGFQHQVFKGIPMVWTPSVANTRMYFLNTNFLYFVYDPMMFFDMTEWKAIPNQVNDRAAQIITAGQFLTSRRRAQGVIHTIDTE